MCYVLSYGVFSQVDGLQKTLADMRTELDEASAKQASCEVITKPYYGTLQAIKTRNLLQNRLKVCQCLSVCEFSVITMRSLVKLCLIQDQTPMTEEHGRHTLSLQARIEELQVHHCLSTPLESVFLQAANMALEAEATSLREKVVQQVPNSKQRATISH